MIPYILIGIGLILRILPHAPNIAPVAAIALFAGAYFNKKIAIWIPLVIMIISDLIIGMHSVILYTWGSFALIVLLGLRLRKKRTPSLIFGSTIVSALLFFIITNFGVWISWYPHTLAGLTDCYVKAIPFFRNTLISNTVFAFAFFGIYEFCKRTVENEDVRRVLIGE